MHKFIVFTVFCVLGFAPGNALADALNHDELQAIVAGREHHDLTSFKGFVRGLATTNSGAFQPAAEAYLNDRPVTDFKLMRSLRPPVFTRDCDMLTT